MIQALASTGATQFHHKIRIGSYVAMWPRFLSILGHIGYIILDYYARMLK